MARKDKSHGLPTRTLIYSIFSPVNLIFNIQGTSTSLPMAARTLPPPSKPSWNHDVFLSFRGEDTRKNFTDHLYTALVQAGIYTFRDDDELPRGKDISTELLKAIRESRISVVVFSKDYASSRWCLDELVEILHCKNTKGHTLFPVFYDVNPSDVRKQTGAFAEAFARHEERFRTEMERVQKWRKALTEAANYSGWDLRNVANGYESEFIKKIVEEILSKVKRAYLSIAPYPVGIDSRVEKLKALLSIGTSHEVRIVGIYGMGGIGKTTIAKALYNQICDGFEGHCCLLDVKETSKQPGGIVQLQEQLLSAILGKKNFQIGNVPRGINLIKERACRKKVLVVLDDVDHLEQLNSLAGNSEWFGSGSRVIVTTRDEHLLNALGVHGKYKVDELNFEESLELFSWHAFRMTHPIEDYLDVTTDLVKYVGGLPLGLEVLGSHLRGRSIVEWRTALEKLQKFPNHQIQKILRLSFDSLDDDTIKDIFLDIACFFIGMNKEFAIKIFDGCGFYPNIGISILVQRSLVTISINELRMHDLIRDMGREIVREKSPADLGRRSRLWFHEDVLNVLSKHTGSEAVEGLVLDLPVQGDVHLKTETFRKMRNLRLLQINSVHLEGCYEDLSEELRWLCWHKCPLKFLPPNFSLNEVVVLELKRSKLKEVWRGKKELNRLKVLNLSYSKQLTTSPNLLQVPSLEILILEGCTSLVEVHDSIEHLEGLVLLNLEGCKSLRKLPRNISNLKSLETLKLSGCLKLDKLPEETGNMVALRELLADGTAIKQLPPSIVLLKNLETLSLSGCESQSSKSLFSRFSSWILPKSSNPTNMLPASVSGLCSLRKLILRGCNLSEDGIPCDIGSLSSLRELDLGGNNFRKLPHGINHLPKLQSLWLDFCARLESISELPESLGSLHASACTSLEKISNLSKKHSLDFFLTGCHNLIEIQGLETSNSSKILHLESCHNLAADFRKSLLQGLSKHDELRAIFLPGSEVPNWFSHQGIGSSISFNVPSLSEGKVQGMLICAVYGATGNSEMITAAPFAIVNNKTRGQQETFRPTFRAIPETREDHYCVCHLPLKSYEFEMESEEEIEVSIKAGYAIEVKKCGVHLLVDQPNIMTQYGSLVEYSHSDTAAEGALDLICVKRGRDDNEAGPSNENVEHCPKRLKLESEALE